MSHNSIPRAFLLIAAGSASLALGVRAQEPQAPSVADAARHSREQKKASAKTPVVITDDTRSGPSAQPSGQIAAGETTPAPEAAATAKSSSKDKEKEAARKKAELAALKQQIADKTQEVDLAKREFALEQDSYYSKPGFSADKEGKTKLDALRADVSQKQDELTKLKAKFAALGGTDDTDTAKPSQP